MTLTASVKCVTRNKLQQQVAATEHSLRTGPAGQATRYGDTSQWQIASCGLEKFCIVKEFVSAMCRTNSVIWFAATCCCDKILLQRQRLHKNYPLHKAICRCDMSPRHIAATCRLVCTDLNVSIIKTVSKTNRLTLKNLSSFIIRNVALICLQVLQVFIMILYAR